MKNSHKLDLTGLELLEILEKRAKSKQRTVEMGKIGSRYIIKKYERRSGDDINSPAFFYLSPENITSIAEIIDALPAKLVQEMDERTGKALEYSFKPQDVTRLKDKLKPMRRITKLEKLGI